jgi:hypothetical protein
MDQNILVGPDVDGGRRFLDLLKEHDIEVTAALWQYDRLLDEWELVLAVPLASKIGLRETYKKMRAILNEHGTAPIDLHRVNVFYTSSTFVKSLRRDLRKMRDRQIRRQPVGDHLVDDGYVYFVK